MSPGAPRQEVSSLAAEGGQVDAESSRIRRWLAALVAACVLGGGIALASALVGDIPWISAGMALAVLTGYALFTLLVLPRVLRRPAETMGGLEIAAVVVTVVAVAAVTALAPWLAMLQFWVYPFLWTLAASTRMAVTASAISAVAVFAALLPWTDDGSWAVTAFVQAVGLASAVGLGLWISAISRYGAERDALVTKLTVAQTELASLHHDAGVTAERERLAAEMHDTIAQTLAGTVMLAQRARRELAAGALGESTLVLVEEAAREALTESRSLVAAGAPVSGGAGLAEALGILAGRIARESGLDVEVRAEPVVGLGREDEVALLRCAQEGLSNARRHSDARRIEVALVENDDGVELRIHDDGVGFDPADPAHGFGLPGLRARLAARGGELRVDGTPGAVVLTARVPRAAVVA